MANSLSIILNNITSSYLPSKIDKVNLSFDEDKYGIIGPNGIGKTTLLKLILDEIKPKSGSIHRTGRVAYVPQLHSSFIEKNATLADVLGVSSILQSITNINNGLCSEHDFEVIGTNWDIDVRVQSALTHFSVENIDINSHFKNLSGGQKTKVLLAKTLIFPTDFILFDEPTNNLDKESRETLYDYIEKSHKGIIVVSHDRRLLNIMNHIINITSVGIDCYGGNYDFFKHQNEINRKATENLIQSRTEQLKKSQSLVQSRLERHQKNESKGNREKKKQIQAKGNYNKIEIKSKQGRSEKTNRRIRLQAEHKLDSVNKELYESKMKLKTDKGLNISLDKTQVANNKVVLNIENLSFGYDISQKIINNFNLKIVGPMRIAITGRNGSGKSTLIQLILGNLHPNTGQVVIGVHIPVIPPIHSGSIRQSIPFLSAH